MKRLLLLLGLLLSLTPCAFGSPRDEAGVRCTAAHPCAEAAP